MRSCTARSPRLARLARRAGRGRRGPASRGAFASIAATALGLTGSLHAAQGALKGPYVTGLSDAEATVRFELETAAPATIELTGPQTGAADASVARPARFESREVSAMHRVRLTGLQPATRYAFVVRASGAIVADGRVVTAPRPDVGGPLSFLVYGDDRTDDAAHASVVRAMTMVPSDFLVNTGDMVADGASARNWQTFFEIEKPLLRERAIFPAIGNHELYDDDAGTNFARYFGFPDASGVQRLYGTMRFGNARFFFLNAIDDWSSGEERQWLERELSRADGEAGLAWRFAVVHQGPWSSGPHGPNMKLVEAGVPRLLASHKIDLLFAGHDHIYERGDAGVLKYIVSGGGGAPLYRDLHETSTARKVEPAYHFVEVSTRGNALQIVAHRADGSVLDRCGFVQGAGWDCDVPRVAPALSASPASGAPVAVPVGVSAAAPAAASSSHGCECRGPGAGARAGAIAAVFAALASIVGVSRARSNRRG